MILDKIDTNDILARFAQEGAPSVREIAAQMRSAFQGMDLESADHMLEAQVDVGRRRYGKGVNLPPQGNFHPSEIMFALSPHMVRSRLLKQEARFLFQYDFDAEGNSILIRMPSEGMTTLCERQGNLVGMLTHRKTISGILLARYDEGGLLESLLEVREWNEDMTGFDSAYGEIYDPLNAGSRDCTWYPWIRLRAQKEDMQRQNFCQRETMRVDYDERRRVRNVWRQIEPEIVYF